MRAPALRTALPPRGRPVQVEARPEGPLREHLRGYSQDAIVYRGVLEDGVNLVEKHFAARASV
ncbi:MAG TPA: hypothetical protein VME46_11760 [Acidimicrobiales bacterium]|nr:hypothetical protein [Acidimicrobiales bacterium]